MDRKSKKNRFDRKSKGVGSMPFERKLVDPYTTSVRVEREERRIANRLHIKLSDALHLGLKILIDLEFENATNPGVTSDLLDSWKRIRDKDSEDLRIYIKIEKERQTLIDKYLQQQAVLAQGEKMIRVWDHGEEKYRTIPESQFEPEWMVKQ